MTDETRWVVLRAFGRSQKRFDGDFVASAAAVVAGHLGVRERIAARVPNSLLVDELGREIARELALSRLQLMARLRHLCDLIPAVTSLLSGAQIPVALLKYAGLHVAGCARDGSRHAGDIDLLLREEDIPPAVQLLCRQGFRAAGVGTVEHHFRPLQDHQGRVVELHSKLLGVRVPGERRFARFETLQAAGALEPAPGLASGCFVLGCRPLVAHLVAHAFAQHRGADGYPLTRALGDLIDVLPGHRQAAASDVAEWVSPMLPASEVRTVLALCDTLEAGNLSALDPRQRAILVETLRCALNPVHRSSVLLARVFHPLSDQPRWRAVAPIVRRALLPTKAEIVTRLGGANTAPIGLRLRIAYAVRSLTRFGQWLLTSVLYRISVLARVRRAHDPSPKHCI